ncbi:hemicentin-1-like [Mya arenaria]|uniref:hemicentin-1-like n=1 Tax=Mya arenaria TaxID=6604 RepID=UPI0022E6F3A5|nr:hemicentin-1-like [Mya arenaria]
MEPRSSWAAAVSVLAIVATVSISIPEVLGQPRGLTGTGATEIPEGAASLAFVFDITGSMYDDLVQVIEGAARILATTLSRREKPLYNYVLVPFHDPDYGPVVVTTDPDDFQYELRNLYVQGGTDCPEMSITAIREALAVSLPNSFIYVFTDARSKDYHLVEEVLAMVQQKQSQVVFVLTGDCGDPTHAGYLAYEQIASTSSGQVFLLRKSQVNEVLNFVRVAVQTRKVNLMSVDVVDSTENEFEIPVDSTLQEITISVSGSKPQISLIDPAGNVFNQRRGLNKLLDIRNALVVNVKEPQAGVWRMKVESDGRHTIRVTGLSSTDFVARFSRKPGTDLVDGDRRPIGGIPTYMTINATDLGPPGALSQVSLVDLHGNILDQYPLTRDQNVGSIYTSPSFIPPEEFFYVQVNGVDHGGYNLRRQTPTAITRVVPVAPNVWMPEVTQGYFGLTAVIVCNVDSHVPYTVRWYKEDQQQGPELYFTDSANVTLELEVANQFAEGIYFCNATNVAGSRRVPTFLDVSEPPPSITVPQNVSVLPGENALLTCYVFSTVDHNVTWHRDGYRDHLRSSQKFVDYNNGSLLVRGVVLEDEGGYTCLAANEGGVSKQTAHIRVQVAPTAKITPPSATFQHGETREFTCNGEGFPEPAINWLRDGRLMVTSERVRLRGNTLELRDLSRGEEGVYTCLAVNPAGEDSVEALLSYIEEPHISVYESKVLVAAGNEAILFCGADGIPKPEIHWYKGEVELKALSYVKISDEGQLRILGAHALDAGEYRCEARNEAGSDSALVSLEVGSAPEIVEIPQPTGVNIGSNTSLACRVSGSPAPTQTWRRADGRPLDFLSGKYIQLGSGDLFITNAGLADEGGYICVATNRFGTDESTPAHVTITGIVPPLFGIISPKMTVIEGEDVTLDCQVLQGNPPPRLLWLQGNDVVRTDEHVKTSEGGRLTIERVQAEHAGDYICLASNAGGNATFIVMLDVQVPPSFEYLTPEDEQINFNILEGDRVVLPCNVEGDPRPRISWYKDESPISLTDYHYYIGEDGSLEIYSAEAADTGLYRCQASNEAGEIEKVLNVYVQVPPVILGDPNEEYTVVVNETIVLPCAASGIPAPEVTWRKNFAPFEPPEGSDRYLFGDHGLTISDVKSEDQAIYECIATNNGGEETKVIVLVVQVPPVIVEHGVTDFDVLKGDEVRLNCESSGDPQPLVEWKKDEQMLVMFDETNGFTLVDSGSIVIGAARVEHSGRYVCIVTNPAGIATRDFTINVQDPPTLPANLSVSREVVEKNPVILHCPASGTPPPIITWYKDGVLISGEQLDVVILEDGSLQLLAADAEDSGSFRCVAENQAGTVSHEVDLKVWVPPKLTGEDHVPGSVEKSTVITGENMTITCPVEGDPKPTITWVKNGYSLTEENLDGRYQISEDGLTLTILDAVVDDTARYKCIAENLAGQTEKNFDVDVYVAPSVDEDSASPEENVVNKDNTLYLDCPVTGIPRPDVLWYKNGEIISPQLDQNLRLHADGRRLQIISARVSDTGSYVCVGENLAGTTERKFDVEVQVPAITDQPGEVGKPEVVANRSLTLTCPAYGVPPPEITWWINGLLIAANSSEFRLLKDGWTLEIPVAFSNHTARFTCRATNPAGESEKAFDVNVLFPPVIPRDNLNLNPKVIVNQSVILNCHAEGKPSPDITWYKNGLRLDPALQTRYELMSGGRQLRLKQAKLDDAATFQCVAENKAGSDSVDFNLRVLVPARIDGRRLHTNPKVKQSSDLSITCPVTGVPPPEVTWFKDGEPISSEGRADVVITNGGQELTIKNAQVEDTGSYTCRAHNEAGDAEIAYKVDVQVGPVINSDDADPTPHVLKGGDVVLHCPATGVPPPRISWLKNGQPIDFASNPYYTMEADGKRLAISNADLSDAGLFTCIATNEAGSAEQEYQLDVWEAPTIDQTGLDLAPTVIKGQDKTLICPATGNPEPAILWLKDGDPVPLDDRIQIGADGRHLLIANASTSDTARYTCVARNAAGQESLSYDMNVFVAPVIDESNVVYFRKVVQNRTIVIECPVSGIPKPEVSWLVNGRPVAEASEVAGLTLTHGGYNLEIPSAQVIHTAVYTCVASNAAGELQKKFDLEVQIPPVIDRTSLETRLTVIENRTRAIVCPVYGIPTPSIIWFKDKAPLFDWPYPRMTLTNKEQRIEITDAQVEDAGIFTCQATNPAGQVKQDFHLEVHIPPSIAESEYVSEISVVRGSVVNLKCKARGVPEPQIAWLMDEEVIEIVENQHIRIQQNGHLLQILDSDVSDAGRYKCHAENKAGIAERLFDLKVNVAPTIKGPSGLQNIWVIQNEPLTLDCPAEGVPPPTITWRRQGDFIQPYSNPRLRLKESGRKLLLVAAQLVDMGEYSCYVENVAGNGSLNFFVNVYVPPTIEQGPNLIQAVVNTGATLPCESLGLPDPIVSWLKDGYNFPSTGLRHRMRISGTIEFTSVRLEDAGTYKCLATNEAGTASSEMKLDVQVPPRVLGRQPLYIDAVKGEGVVLPCDVTGTPKPAIIWQKGTTVLRGGQGKEIIENGSLHIQRTQESDGGTYVCIAQNNAGTAFGQIRLNIFIAPEIPVRETSFIINNGQNIVLPCRATGRPRPKLTWEKDGVTISRSNSFLRILRNGLAIPFARSEDDGTYTCVATNAAGTTSVELRLQVQVPPQIGEASRLLTFTVGETADIPCAAIGIPPPSIRWLKDGRRLDSSAKYDITEFGNLVIRGLKEEDTGSYLCTASNVAGQASQERLIRIQVPPSFLVVPRITEVLLGDRLVLRCTADGIPTPTIHWKRDDAPVPSHPSVNGRSVYIVYHVRPEDGGVYTCIAQNPAGEAQHNTVVNVKVPPEILTPPGNKAVTIAERVVLACSVGGDPPPEVMWLKDGRQVQLSERIRKLSNGSLVIYRSTSSDAGQYKCVATNDVGSSSGTAMLTIREPPAFSITPVHTRVEQGFNARLDCVGSGEPEPDMTWMMGWEILTKHRRLSILPNNSLLLVAAQQSDSGTYRCMASNNLGQSFVDVNITVAVNGGWSDWQSWEECSASCGQGRQQRHRSCDNPEPDMGKPCLGEDVEYRDCTVRECPVSGAWGMWQSWASCSKSCGDGSRSRRRLCDSPRPQFGGEDCQDEGVQMETCNLRTCSVDGGWSNWSPWQQCSVECGNGFKERVRSCDNPAPSNQGLFCPGSDTERQACKLKECPLNGNWGGWGYWSPCTLSCGSGTRTRIRLCNNPAPQHDGLFCSGEESQLDYCNSEPCPVHGGWTEWSDYGECSASCGGGHRRRFRSCSSPPPSTNGRLCSGAIDDSQTCNSQPCPVDGRWGEWLEWTTCSQTCDTGRMYRTRECIGTRHGGRQCRGDSEQIMNCVLKPCYSIPVIAEGTLVGTINNVQIPHTGFTADMIPLPDGSATHVNVTIRGLPTEIAPHFRHLISALSPVYWSTATEIDGAANGFTLSGGEFTRESQVQYTTGEILKLSQYSKGVDDQGRLQLDIVVRGNVPDIDPGRKIEISPYWEQYTQTGPSTVHAQSTRLFHVDGFMLPYAWNHSIIYNGDQRQSFLVQKLHARNLNVIVAPERDIV